MKRAFDTTENSMAALLLLWRAEGRRIKRDREMAALGYSQADIREEREREERCPEKQTGT